MLRDSQIRVPKLVFPRILSPSFGAIMMALVWLSIIATTQAAAVDFRAAMLRATEVTADRLTSLRAQDYNDVVVIVEGASAQQKRDYQTAAKNIANQSLALHYWIEIARCPQLADAHPEWMASLQTHDQWRRFYPHAQQPASHEVVKTYPWVPILSREPYAAQLDRVRQLLADLPSPRSVFLNDLQGAPSACGCGSPLCRWTATTGTDEPLCRLAMTPPRCSLPR